MWVHAHSVKVNARMEAASSRCVFPATRSGGAVCEKRPNFCSTAALASPRPGVAGSSTAGSMASFTVAVWLHGLPSRVSDRGCLSPAVCSASWCAARTAASFSTSETSTPRTASESTSTTACTLKTCHWPFKLMAMVVPSPNHWAPGNRRRKLFRLQGAAPALRRPGRRSPRACNRLPMKVRP